MSRLVYSSSFTDILSKMINNNIANKLLELKHTSNNDISYNYISVMDSKDIVSFTPQRKVVEKLSSIPENWKIIRNSKFLRDVESNNLIFKKLGYDRENFEFWTPIRYDIGIILSETVSKISGNTYVMFKDIDSNKVGVVNKSVLGYYEDPDVHNKMFEYSRNNVKIGRLVRSLLTTYNISFIDSDIETFVNQYKAVYDFVSDGLKQFDVVKGNDILKWYEGKNYASGGGSLNNSCMSNVDSEYLNIYSRNSNISMIILYSDTGYIENGVYISKEIKGRALLWDCEIDGEKSIFMDRIYTKDDSDVELFKQYANRNGFWYKIEQSMEPKCEISNGSIEKKSKIKVDLEKVDFDYYPYMDTLCYIDLSNNIATNYYIEDSDSILCRSTSGGCEEAYEYEY
jgi:hypothetical protein